MNWYKSWIFSDGHEKGPYQEKQKEMIENDKESGGYLCPWMKVDEQEFNKSEIQECNNEADEK